MRARGHFSVAPRYSGGSPAQVDERLAERVASEEVDGFLMSLAGAYGPEGLARAERLGLEGIVEERVERHGGWEVRDLISDRHFFRLTRQFGESERRFFSRIESARRRYPGRIVRVIDAIDTVTERGGAR